MTIDRCSPETGRAAEVLVVDDDPLNRELLRDVLARNGYQVSEAGGGFTALDLVDRSPPDAILLDVMMPDLDGFEVCRRLQADPRTVGIPVILVTALRDRASRLRGAQVGARDFITKPVETQDVVVRVRNAVEAKRLLDFERAARRRLEALEVLRDSLIHMLVHDLRTPLCAIGGNLELLRFEFAAGLGTEGSEIVDDALDITKRLAEMVDCILDVSRLEAGELEPQPCAADLVVLTREAVALTGPAAGRVRVSATKETIAAECDPDLVRRVVLNLVGNALQFTDAATPVSVEIEASGETVRVFIEDLGPGVPPEHRERIFDKYAHLERRGRSIGLGLAFCKLAVEAHGGLIGVAEGARGGSRFWFELPAVAAPSRIRAEVDPVEG